MVRLIQNPTQVKAAGNKPKVIDEFIGRVNTGTVEVSIARMRSPAGWVEPRQTPEFTEYTVVLNGMLRVETDTTLAGAAGIVVLHADATEDLHAAVVHVDRNGECILAQRRAQQRPRAVVQADTVGDLVELGPGHGERVEGGNGRHLTSPG